MKPSFFHDVDLIELSPLHRLLFIGMWCWADREGRLVDNPRQIRHDVLPYDECDVNQILTDLVTRNFILRYSVSGRNFIQIRNFNKHQNPHQKEAQSEIPAPDKHQTSTGLAPYKSEISTIPAVNRQLLSRLIPDSLLLIPDSLNPQPTISDKPRSFENTPGEQYVDLEQFFRRWRDHKNFKKPTKTQIQYIREKYPAIRQITESDLALALDGYHASEWAKSQTPQYPIFGFAKDPHSWIVDGAGESEVLSEDDRVGKEIQNAQIARKRDSQISAGQKIEPVAKSISPSPSIPPAVSESEFENWFEERWVAHPRKKAGERGKALAAAWRHFSTGKFTLEEFEWRHKAWCSTDEWTWKNGITCPALEVWINDYGYRYLPEDSPGHLNPGARM